MYAPNWLFLYPGIALIMIGIIGSIFLMLGQLPLFHVVLSIHSLLYCMSFLLIGFTIINMFFIVKLYAYNHHFIPEQQSVNWNEKLKEDKFIFGGGALAFLGMLLSGCALLYWKNSGFSELVPEVVMRITIPAVTLIELGLQLIFFGFMIGILKIKVIETSI